jgi:hypothetical protein
MKHKDEIIEGHIFLRILFSEGMPAGDGGWPEEEVAEALGVGMIEGEPDQFGEVYQSIDRDAIVSGWWRISWPEHCLTTDFTSDANYNGPFDTEEEATQ